MISSSSPLATTLRYWFGSPSSTKTTRSLSATRTFVGGAPGPSAAGCGRIGDSIRPTSLVLVSISSVSPSGSAGGVTLDRSGGGEKAREAL